MTSSTVRVSAKIITWIHSNPGMIVLQPRYYSFQRTFPIHKYGDWLEIGCMARFFATAVPRATMGNKLALDPRMGCAFSAAARLYCDFHESSAALCLWLMFFLLDIELVAHLAPQHCYIVRFVSSLVDVLFLSI